MPVRLWRRDQRPCGCRQRRGPSGPADLQATLADARCRLGRSRPRSFGPGTSDRHGRRERVSAGERRQRSAHDALAVRDPAALLLKSGDLGGLDIPGRWHGSTSGRLLRRPISAAAGRGSIARRCRSRSRMALRSSPDGEIVAPEFAMALVGSVQIPEGQAAMTATVRPAAAGRTTAASSFDVAGPWNRPNFTPDVRGLIRRSEPPRPCSERPYATPAGETR